jgi:hypothetical protein
LTTVDSSQLTVDVRVERFVVWLDRCSVFSVVWEVEEVTFFAVAVADAFLTTKLFGLASTLLNLFLRYGHYG